MKNIKKGWWGFIIFSLLIVAVVTAIVIALNTEKTPVDSAHIRVPIVMYHDVKKKPVCEDDYLISTDTLKCDIEQMLKAGFHPIPISKLIDYVADGQELPDKPVILTFDDGYKSIQTQVLPLLEKYKTPASVSLIGARAENIDDGCDDEDYLLWSDVRSVAKSKYIEIVSHSAYLHVYRARKGVSQLPDEDAAHYKMMLSDDIRALKDFTNREKITMLPVFAYPYGYVEPTAEAVFREQGFAATMTSEEHVNLISRDKECLYQLGRLNRSGKMTTAQLISWMNKGKGQ